VFGAAVEQKMALRGLYTKHVREALRTPPGVGYDVLLIAILLSLFGTVLMVGVQATHPFTEKVEIDLGFASLPKYALLSLGRGFAAYFLSLGFTLAYGTIAAHNRRAEVVMIPILDVLQAIPVLGFLPGLVLALVALFPRHELGLEMACILMIFTGQVWNMTFSYHGSLRAIPSSLREVAAINGFSRWRVFRQLEVPASMIGLIYNSMMSMAGGWFFLTVTEAFTLGKQDYRLPGIGSYMSEASLADNHAAMFAGVIAMMLMIIFADQVVWRPMVAWSQRFKMEDVAGIVEPKSWVLDWVRRSAWMGGLLSTSAAAHRSMLNKGAWSRFVNRTHPATWVPAPLWAGIRLLVQLALLLALLVGVLWGGWSIVRLLFNLPLVGSGDDNWKTVVLSLGASFLRTTCAVLLGAAWTLPVGIIIGRSPRWSERLQPVIQVLASFPAPMLFMPVTALLLRLHVNFNLGCVALMLLGTQWYILFNVIAGASSIPADLEEVASVYHFNRVQCWLRLYIPCVFPYLLTGLITAAGGAWNATIVAEYVQMKTHTYAAFGLGSLISRASSNDQYSLLAASVVTMAIAVVTINRLFWRRLYRLAESRYSLTGR
jgi:NitT/TauT family transport system permease protein